MLYPVDPFKSLFLKDLLFIKYTFYCPTVSNLCQKLHHFSTLFSYSEKYLEITISSKDERIEVLGSLSKRNLKLKSKSCSLVTLSLVKFVWTLSDKVTIWVVLVFELTVTSYSLFDIVLIDISLWILSWFID